MNEKWQKFQYNSFAYAEEIEQPTVLRDDARAYIIRGYSADENMAQFLWAADAPEPVIEAIGSEAGMLSFLPRAWVPAFEAAGFAIRAVFRDYWKSDLSDIPEAVACGKTDGWGCGGSIVHHGRMQRPKPGLHLGGARTDPRVDRRKPGRNARRGSAGDPR